MGDAQLEDMRARPRLAAASGSDARGAPELERRRSPHTGGQFCRCGIALAPKIGVSAKSAVRPNGAHDSFAHRVGADLLAALLHDIRGSITLRKHLADG